MIVRSGHSRLDLAFSIGMLGLLVLVFLPIARSREAARKEACANHLGANVGLAHLQYGVAHGRFCGYVNSVGQDNKCVSWAVLLLPYIDRSDLWAKWSQDDYEWEDEAQTIPSKKKHSHAFVEVLVCPDNLPVDKKGSPLSYVVNGGYALDTPPECADDECTKLKAGTGENLANGVFHDQYGPTKDPKRNRRFFRASSLPDLDSNDGAARTLMMTENRQWVTTWYTTTQDRAPLAIVWFADMKDEEGKEVAARQINARAADKVEGRLDYARPSSYHPGGVNVAFCDGHVKFVNDRIDYAVYKQLLTSASKKSSDTDQVELGDESY